MPAYTHPSGSGTCTCQQLQLFPSSWRLLSLASPPAIARFELISLVVEMHKFVFCYTFLFGLQEAGNFSLLRPPPSLGFSASSTCLLLLLHFSLCAAQASPLISSSPCRVRLSLFLSLYLCASLVSLSFSPQFSQIFLVFAYLFGTVSCASFCSALSLHNSCCHCCCWSCSERRQQRQLSCSLAHFQEVTFPSRCC